MVDTKKTSVDKQNKNKVAQDVKHITPDSKTGSGVEKSKVSLMKNKLQDILSKQKDLKAKNATESVSFLDTMKSYFGQVTNYAHSIALSIGDSIQVIVNYITKHPSDSSKTAKDSSYLTNAIETVGGDHFDSNSTKLEFVHTDYPKTAGPINFGLVIIFVFIGIGGAWSVLCPIANSSQAEGRIVAPYQKMLQNTNQGSLELKKLFVKEGQALKKGDKVAKLDSSVFTTDIDKILGKIVLYKCMEERLSKVLAFMDTGVKGKFDLDVSAFDPFLKPTTFVEKHSNVFDDYIAIINQVDEQKCNILSNQKALLHQNIVMLESLANLHQTKIKTLEANLQHYIGLYDIYETEYNKQKKLYEARRKLNNNLLEESQYEQVYHEALRKRNDVKHNIEDTKLKIDLEKKDFERQISEHYIRNNDMLNDTRMKIDEFVPLLNMYESNMEKTLLCAPYDSEVTATRFKEGIMIQGGHDLQVVDMIPNNVDKQHELSARVKAQDILGVEEGCEVKVQFAALQNSGKGSPDFAGRVVSVTKDIVVYQPTNRDENGKILPGGATTQQPCYIVKVELDKEQLDNYIKKYNLQNKLFPMAGMQASLFIKTGEKTLMQYMLGPLTKAWKTAMSGSA